MIKMTEYVAFLRGVNVGGNNIIKMAALKEEFEKMCFLSVKTYIQSGNVLFRSPSDDKEELENMIRKSLSAKFKYDAKVMIRSRKDLENTIHHFPKIFNDNEWKHNVIFLSKAIDPKDMLNQFEIKKEIEQIHYCAGTLFWSAKLDGITRSTMLKLSSQKVYKEMTVRNLNTTKRILEIMNASK
jgi:uncharacterized protein (DUF1697 family)